MKFAFWPIVWLCLHGIQIVRSKCTDYTLKDSLTPPKPGFEQTSKAQTGEDLYLYKYLFYGKSSGRILESGALDGLRFSSTYMLHSLFNWTAIHVEGSLHNFEKLVVNRPESRNVHAILCDGPRPPLHYLSHKGGGGISGIREFMDDDFYQRYYHDPTHYNISLVECITLNSLLEKLGICHLDVWILDVEGGEAAVLKGIDLNRYDISVIVIETTSTHTADNLKHIRSFGYVCKPMARSLRFVSNHVCVKQTFQPSSINKDGQGNEVYR